MEENFRKALYLGIEIINKFHYGSPEHKKGEAIIAWSAEQLRRLSKVQLSIKKQKDENSAR